MYPIEGTDQHDRFGQLGQECRESRHTRRRRNTSGRASRLEEQCRGSIVGRCRNSLQGERSRLVRGLATFSGLNTANVQTDGRSDTQIQFEYAVIAAGSRPVELPGFEFDGEYILNSAHVLELRSIPEHLLIVGAGYIGLELSTAFAKLGTEVTVVEMLDSTLPRYEDNISRVVRKQAETLDIEFSFGERAVSWERAKDGIVVTTESHSGDTNQYSAEKALVAIGRRPVTETANLEAVDVEITETGFIRTDDQTRTTAGNIFAIGDVAGEPMLAHKASKEGRVAAEMIAGEPARLDYQAIPAVVFTEPEVGVVGYTQAEAEAAGYTPVVGQISFEASGRALTPDRTGGFVRIVAENETGFVLGAQITGPEASELVSEIGLAIEMGARLEDILATVHTHPTLSEVVMEAAADARNQAIHTLNRST